MGHRASKRPNPWSAALGHHDSKTKRLNAVTNTHLGTARVRYLRWVLKPPEVLRGNRADTTTLHGLLASLKRRFGIHQAIFVFDNGMSSTLNLEAMRKEDLHL